MRKRFLLIFLLDCFFFPSLVLAEHKLTIKYRPTAVDVDKPYFESLDTSDSSLVQGAWFDAKNEYLIINLSGTNYDYCGLDKGSWQQFKKSSSFGQAYHRLIKGRFDCGVNPVPNYNK